MTRPLAALLHILDAARTAGTLVRTVRILARQLDNAHLLAASEGARADRAELRVAELEASGDATCPRHGRVTHDPVRHRRMPDLTIACNNQRPNEDATDNPARVTCPDCQVAQAQMDEEKTP